MKFWRNHWRNLGWNPENKNTGENSVCKKKSEWIPWGLIDGTPKNILKKISKEFLEGISGGFPNEIPGLINGRLADRISNQIPEKKGGIPQGIPGETPRENLVIINDGIMKGILGGITSSIPEKMPEQIHKTISRNHWRNEISGSLIKKTWMNLVSNAWRKPGKIVVEIPRSTNVWILEGIPQVILKGIPREYPWKVVEKPLIESREQYMKEQGRTPGRKTQRNSGRYRWWNSKMAHIHLNGFRVDGKKRNKYRLCYFVSMIL